MTESAYQQALDYLYSFIDYSVKRRFRYSPEVLDLQRVVDLLESLGDPQNEFSSILIAGTKGKGSVAAMIASCLTNQGYRTGMYSSPHLRQFDERIRVDGEPISEGDLVQHVETLKAVMDPEAGLTVFELITAIGFMHFAQQTVDWAVVEVGLGGRLDATNILEPEVTVITSLSYDHMDLLGQSLSDIAREKAGIIKIGIPVILAPQQHEALKVVQGIAFDREAPLVQVGEDWLFAPANRDLERQSLHIWSVEEQPLMDEFVESAGGEEWAPPRYEIPLLGHHQVINTAVAYAALQTLKSQGVNLTDQAIREGLATVSWQGRFQILSKDPIVVIDSAHNRDSALKLRIALDDYFPGHPVTLIFGASADKDIAGMLTELTPRISRLIATQADHPRAEDPQFLANVGHSHGLKVEVVVPVADALTYALEKQRPSEVILAAGSVFIAGETLTAWETAQQTDQVVVG